MHDDFLCLSSEYISFEKLSSQSWRIYITQISLLKGTTFQKTKSWLFCYLFDDVATTADNIVLSNSV